MKVLFVSSGNNSVNCPIAINQANSIIKFDTSIEIQHYRIIGKGFWGYLKNLKSLRQNIKEFNPDLIHSQYSFSGFLAALTFTRIPIVASLMGSDVQMNRLLKLILIVFSKYWQKVIVKSENMKKKSSIKKALVIPNGVDFSNFEELEKAEARKKLNLDLNKKYVLFFADPGRAEKNYLLAKEAFDLIKSDNIELLVAYNIPFELTTQYYYASDVVLLTSLYEGSPNVIKEAMACNKAIVSTDVGDVAYLLKGLEGCYVTTFNPSQVCESIKAALTFNQPTKGRNRLMEFGIDSQSIAKKIIQLYKHLVKSPVKILAQNKYSVCNKGIWDNSIPNISYDEQGVSNYCLLQQKMMSDYPRGEIGKQAWVDLVAKIKQSGKKSKYDCIVGVSGGVDSSYLLHLCKHYNLRPLAVHLDNGFNSEIAVNNIHKILKVLNFDLITHVIVYEEIKDLFRAYIKACLPWIDAPTDLAIKATMYKVAQEEGIKYIIRGNDFRSEGKQPTEWTYSDSRQLNFIHKKFGFGIKLKTYPMQSFFKMAYAGVIKKIKDVRPYYYLDYDKETAKKILKANYDWQDYGGHHHENIFTKFAMSYWLPKKFKIDKRKINLSAQVLSGAITREEAINKVAEPFDEPQKLDETTDYILKKLDFTKEEFNLIMTKENKNYKDYPSNYNLIYRNIKYFKWLIKSLYGFKPMSIDSNEMIK